MTLQLRMEPRMFGTGHGRQILNPVVVLDSVLVMDLDLPSEVEIAISEANEIPTAGVPAAKMRFGNQPMFHHATVARKRVIRFPKEDVSVGVTDAPLEVVSALPMPGVEYSEFCIPDFGTACGAQGPSGRVMTAYESLSRASQLAASAFTRILRRLRFPGPASGVVAMQETRRSRILLWPEDHRLTASAFTEVLALLFGNPGRARSSRGQDAPALCHRAILSERSIC